MTGSEPIRVLARSRSDRRTVDGPTLWFDVGAFLQYFRYMPRPTGIQRVEMEIFAELARSRWPRGAIRFCRLDQDVDLFESVEIETLTAAFYDAPVEPPPVAGRRARGFFASLGHTSARRARLWRRRLMSLIGRPACPGVDTESFRCGDILVCLGTSWENPRYVAFLERARRELGVRIAVLVYDIIPITHPQWVSVDLVRRFGEWLDGVLGNADLLLTISKHSRGALHRLAAERRMALPPVEILWLGSGFRAVDAVPEPRVDAKLPAHYVLYVSTVEARKNHAQLLRVWRGLIAKHGSAAVPDLVFIGHRGWLVDELMAELSADGPLRGKVILRPGLSDAEVATAYRRCLFTVFPSFMEGWGLPVSESLTHGKLCVASNRGALPEVGGDLVDYFDPDDDAAALAAIERAILDGDYRRDRKARIRAEFRARTWADCTAALIARLDLLYGATEPRSAGAPHRSRASQGAADVL